MILENRLIRCQFRQWIRQNKDRYVYLNITMRTFETIVIKFSKFKFILLLFGCGLFVAAGIGFVLSPRTFLSILVHNPAMVFIVGCVTILFFGFVGFSYLQKLMKNEPALIISTEGITDNSSGVSAGFIPWSDIIAVKEQVVANQRFLNLIVKNPQEYIDKQTSAFKRKIMQKNHDLFGTGIGISVNALKISYKELKQILEEKVLESRSHRS
jgi:hypothetical protein